MNYFSASLPTGVQADQALGNVLFPIIRRNRFEVLLLLVETPPVRRFMASLFVPRLFLLSHILLHISSEQALGKVVEELDKDPGELAMDVVRETLHAYHKRNILVLEADCFASDCMFRRAKMIIADMAKATEYWNYLNCVKYGKTCPRNGKWGLWGEYESCSARCGDGYKIRWRDCNSPHAMYGGLGCQGRDHDLAPCHSNENTTCAPDPSLPGTWGPWSPWSHCEGKRTSGSFRTRKRQCLPNFNNEECEAYAMQKLACKRAEIDVDGGWSDWGLWSECTTKRICGYGVRIRTRSCSLPQKSGRGLDCMGPSSETIRCHFQDCDHEVPNIAHFLPESFLRYQKITPSFFLNVYLKFMPTSDVGLLFQYSTYGTLQEAIKSGSVKIKKPTINRFVNVNQKEDVDLEAKVKQDKAVADNEDYVFAELQSATLLKIHILINQSEKIVIPLSGVRPSRWNELRLSIVGDMIWVRLNDGENIESRLEEFLDSKIANGTKWIDRHLTKFTDFVKGLFNPNIRQIFPRFDGEVGLGAVRKDFKGFRGYVSHFAVNYRFQGLRIKPKSEIRKRWDPFKGSHITLRRERLALLSLQTYFNGRSVVELPLTASWVKMATSRFSANKISGDVATFELIIKPECEDGLFFFIRSAENPFTHWKLSIDARTTVRLAMSYGGEITLLKSGKDIHPGAWNVVTLQLVRTGRVHLEVNGNSYYDIMPTATKGHQPHRVIYVGGFGKAIEHDVLLGKDPTPEVQKEFRSFQGYIYSVKQNHLVYHLSDLPLKNTFRMVSSGFVSRTNLASTVLFFSTSFDKPKVDKEDDLVNFDVPSEHRALICHIPFMSDIKVSPHVSWYRNDIKVEESSIHWTEQSLSNESHVAKLYFGNSPDNSADLSGIYQCVMSISWQSFVAKTYAVAIVPEDIVYYGTQGWGWLFKGYTMELRILTIVGVATGAIIALLILVSCVKKMIKKNSLQRKNMTFSELASNVHKGKIFRKRMSERMKDQQSSSDSSSSPKPTFSKTGTMAKKVDKARKNFTKKIKRGESKPLLQTSDSDDVYEEEKVFRMGSLIDVRRKRRSRTRFKHKSTEYKPSDD